MIYVSLSIEVKFCVDAVNADAGSLDTRFRQLKFCDRMPTADEFREVDKKDFKELKKR